MSDQQVGKFDELLTPDEVAALFDCEPQTIITKLAGRWLPGVKVGRGWRIPRRALMEHLHTESMRNVRNRPDRSTPAPLAVQVLTSPVRRQPPKLPDLTKFTPVSRA